MVLSQSISTLLLIKTIAITNYLIIKVSPGGGDRFVRDDELESDGRSPLVSRSNPVAAAFELAKLRKKFRRAQNHNQEGCVVR